MTRIILVRHGETDWNKEQKFQGRIDVELNEAGKIQADILAERLKGLKIDYIYSSPLSRALVTAKKIAEHHNLEVEIVEDFTEIEHGEWEGLHLLEVKERYGDLYNKWLTSPHDLKMPKGESLRDVRKRSVRALNKIIAAHPDDTVLIAAHDAINKVLICYALDMDNCHFWQIKQGNSAINILEYDEISKRFTITLLNDTCHLGGVLDSTAEGAM
ncbi:MAG: histidine phosphatase family protein [Actinobacteria bacterium]|nr:histidine phosphatase family protein [Actinomycetota bacterium]